MSNVSRALSVGWGCTPVSSRTLVISGTDTGIGKTWSAIALARALAETGLSVSVRKPVESFDPSEGAPDSRILAAALGTHPDEVCSPEWSYPLALAPPMAAASLRRAIPSTRRLVEDLGGAQADVLLVEGVGGPRSPLAADGDTVDLARALGADDVIVISDATLGTISRTLLCVEAFAPLPCHVLLNRFDPEEPLHVMNRDWFIDKRISVHTDPSAMATILLRSHNTTLEVR
jgi:dethiobiotin synthetase